MYQYDSQQEVGGFGAYDEEAMAADAKSNAIRSVGRVAGGIVRALLLRSAQNNEDAPAPCPDAQPNQAPEETPCARKAAELRARAAAWREARRAARR